MASYFILGPASGVDCIDLNGTAQYGVQAGTYKAPPVSDHDPYSTVPKRNHRLDALYSRPVAMQVRVLGEDWGARDDLIEALYRMKQRAIDGATPHRLGEPIVLRVRLGEGSGWVTFDVGDIVVTPQDPSGNDVADYLVDLSFACLPHARGETISTPVSPTFVVGQNGLYYPGIPGSAPAPCTLTIKDVSTSSKVIRSLRIGRIGLAGGLAPGDVVPTIGAVHVSPAVAVSDAAAYGGTKAQLSLGAGADWTSLATVTQAGAQTRGTMDVWARMRDAGLVGAPTDLAGTPQTTGGTLGYSPLTIYATSLIAGVEGTAGGPLVATWTNPYTYQEDFETGATLAPAFVNATGGGTVAVTAGGALSGGYSLRCTTAGSTDEAFLANAVAVADTGAFASASARCLLKIAAINDAGGHLAVFSVEPRVGIVSVCSVAGTYKIVIEDGLTTHTSAALATQFATGTAYDVELVVDNRGPYVVSVYIGGVLDTAYTPGLSAALDVSPTIDLGILPLLGTVGASADIRYDDVFYLIRHDATLARTNTASAPTNSLDLTWTADAAATDSNIYIKLAGGTWRRVATGSGAGSYTLAAMPTTPVGAPPSATVFGTQVRARAGLAGSAGTYSPPIVSSLDATLGSHWQWVLLGTFDLPPIALQTGRLSPPWVLRIESKAGLARAVVAEIDCIMLLDHLSPQIYVSTHDLDSSTKYSFRIDTRPDGYVSCTLLDGTGAIVGMADCIGQFNFSPGDNVPSILAILDGGVADVVDAKYTVQADIQPRVGFLRGRN